MVVWMGTDKESHRYASDFDEVFKQCDWTSRLQQTLELVDPLPVGVFLEMPDRSAPSADALYRALTDADIPFQLVRLNAAIEQPITLKIGYKP